MQILMDAVRGPAAIPEADKFVADNVQQVKILAGLKRAAKRAEAKKIIKSDPNTKAVSEWLELIHKSLVIPSVDPGLPARVSRQEHNRVARMTREDLMAWLQQKQQEAYTRGVSEGYSLGTADMAVSFDVAAHDEFGFGKERVKRLNAKANNELACILGGYATRDGIANQLIEENVYDKPEEETK